MPLLTFPHRETKPELMDDPECNKKLLIRTVRQFRLINLLFSASRRLIKRKFVSRMEPGRMKPYTFLDIGAGGCDTALWLADYCKKKGIPIRISCLDNDPRIAGYARSVIKKRENIELFQASVFDISRMPRFDFIFSNHFLHHFSDSQIPQILDLVEEKTEVAFLMNDLCRSRLSYLGYEIFALLFLYKSFARYDGKLSIRRGFTPEDLRHLITGTKNPEFFSTGKTFPGRIYIHGFSRGRSR
ncbi:methyltransferase domain-containing protein [Marispirochaeta aestuarii]|uniref:methyltransferase domain-containing protein n=1 Tax=Marispirochaeta aestuarii TaxID=1963862 RepID=UPI002ABE2F4D|nr:methyltransferase domain-containing protein [Marispirochaeta aestuarii]